MKGYKLRVQDDYEHESGSLSYWEQSVLCGLARIVGAERILETGTLSGSTTKALADAHPDAEIFSVDKNQGYAESAHRRYGSCRVHFLHANALDILKNLRPTVDFVFLDDNHTADHVREEIEAAIEFQQPDMIVTHDVVPNSRFGLADVVHEFGGFIIDLPVDIVSGGLGVIEP